VFSREIYFIAKYFHKIIYKLSQLLAENLIDMQKMIFNIIKQDSLI